jgi:hypothetical protein
MLLTAGWLSFLAAITPPLAGAGNWLEGGVSSAGFAFLIFSLILAWFTPNAVVRPQFITNEGGAFSGAGEEYLMRFPEV